MLKIPKDVHVQMIAHAKKCYPQEACGFVAGIGDNAKKFIIIENTEHSSVSYAMDSKQQMKAFKLMDENKWNMLGIFHSHVASPAVPSQKDKLLAFYPEVSYLIVSLSDMENPDLKSFKIVEGKVTSEELQIQ
jgi:[CysO sulfur-carrier protein]-S-L-cysteine hydrolase